MRRIPFSLVVVLAACGGSDINQPTAGSIRVTATTTGDRPDADGYAAVLDGGAGRALGIGGTVTFSEVEAGDHDLLLEGIAPNCAVDGDNPVGLVVSAGATEVVAFAIACSAELVRLEVSTATTGASPDPDGYTLQIDGAAGQRIGANAALTITGLTAGDHTVRLSNSHGQSLEMILEVFNVLHLFDSDWGLVRGIQGNGLLQLVGYDPDLGRGIYTLRIPRRRALDSDASRWRMQLGARYTF